MKLYCLSIAFLSTSVAFLPKQSIIQKTELKSSMVSDGTLSKPIFDPLGLYPRDSPERLSGMIQPLEDTTTSLKMVTDPMNLYKDKAQVSHVLEMSESLPFLPRPKLLDGTLPGDRGFDPFNFVETKQDLDWYRRSEQKHGRIAMLAAVGWPMAELFHKTISTFLGMEPLLASHDRVPSILNDGLSHAALPGFWIPLIAATAAIELGESFQEEAGTLNLGRHGPFVESNPTKRFYEEGEIFNGRLAMLAITGFAMQEFLLKSAVVDQIPIFFKPLNVALEQLLSSGGVSV